MHVFSSINIPFSISLFVIINLILFEIKFWKRVKKRGEHQLREEVYKIVAEK